MNLGKDENGKDIIAYGYNKATNKAFPITQDTFNTDKASPETNKAILDSLQKKLAEKLSMSEATERNNLEHEQDVRKFHNLMVRECAGAPPQIKEFITEHGRGMGNAQSLTQEQKDILKALYDNSIPCPQDITLYRTDKTNWLEDIFQDDKMFHINTLLQTTLDKDLVIKENEGSVKQKMEILISKGTKIFCPNNAGELEIDIPYKYNVAITNKRFDEEGIPIYTVQIF